MPDALVSALPADAANLLLPILLRETTAGVAFYDAGPAWRFGNAAFAAMLPLPAALSAPGTPLAAQLAAWRAAGLLDAGGAERLAAAFATTDRGVVAWQGNDGRYRELTTIAVPGGSHIAMCRDTTEARVGEVRLAHERAAIARLLTNMRDCVVLMDPQGMILHTSAVSGALLDLPEELIRPGTLHADILRYFYRRGDFGFDIPEDAFVADRRARIVAARNITYPSRMPDGTWVEYNFQTLEDEHMLITVRDITALKERELERERAGAAEQRDRLDTLLAHLQDFVVLFDEQDRVLIGADPGRLIGLAADRIAPGQRLHEVLAELTARGDLGPPPADPMADAVARVARIRDQGGAHAVFRMATGAWVEFTFRLLHGGRMLLIGRDVSEMKQAQDKIEAERTLLREMVDSMDAMVVLLDPEARVVLSNGRGQALLDIPGGLTEVGGNLADSMRYMVRRGDFGEGVDEERFVRDRVEAVLSRQPLRLVRPGPGGRWIEFAYTPISAGRVVAQGRDVTELKQREAELEQERDAAEAAGRAKIAFLAAMSHEIRTPMNGVLGMLEVLGRSELQPGQERMVGVMRDSAQALLRILDDVLDFSKIEAGRMEFEAVPFSLQDLVQGTVETLMPEARRRGLALFADPFGNGPDMLLGDPTRVRQIMFNLVGNALKFTERGFVRISVATTPRNGKAMVALTVEDSGIGMDAVTVGRLFQPFTQAESSTTRRFGGTGLGLSIVRRLTELMGGGVTAESTPGRGSRFVATLRLGLGAMPAAAPPPPTTATAVPMPAGEARLRVVDDHPVNREVLTRQLELLGIRAEVAPGGVEALAAWRRDRHALLLLDIHMPEMDGFALARAIRAEEQRLDLPRTTLIAVTANALRGEADLCYAAGMDGFLAKPVMLDALSRALGRFLPELAEQPGAAGGALFDPEALRSLFGQDTQRLLGIIESFADQAGLDIAAMAEAAPKQQAEAAHRLKGAARMVGARLLAEEAQALEAAARGGNAAGVARGLERLPVLLAETCQSARARLGQPQSVAGVNM